MVLLPCIEGFIIYEVINLDDGKAKDFFALMYLSFAPISEALFSLILVVSACYIGAWVKNYTKNKQNSCLLTWHFLNLLVFVAINEL